MAIRLELPADFDEDDILDFLRTHVKRLEGAMDLSTPISDPRVTVFPAEITGATLGDDEVWFSYKFDWTVYYGCSDQNSCDEEHLEVIGRREGCFLIFAEHVSQQRSTFEEF